MQNLKSGRRASFLGQDGFIWWIGVVVDRQDPLHLGRCRVRIKGIHSENTSEISNENIPWAQPLNPINNSNVSPTTLKEGDLVIGFFMDGEQAQYPIIFGTLPIIPEESKANKSDKNSNGFKDSRNEEQLNLAPQTIKSIEYKTDGSGVKITNESGKNYPNRYDEPTTSRLCRNENIDNTIVKTKQDSQVKNIKVFDGESKWSEPDIPYKAVYPYNHVIETESGNLIELDDTKDAERIHIYHRSGTFTETHPNGSKVEKITKDNYEIILGSDHVYIMGKCNITVQGAANIRVENDCNLQVAGDLNANIDQDVNWNVNGKMTWNIKDKVEWNFSSTLDWNVSSSTNWTIGSTTNIKAPTINLN